MKLQYHEQPSNDSSDLEIAITGDERLRRLHKRILTKFTTRV